MHWCPASVFPLPLLAKGNLSQLFFKGPRGTKINEAQHSVYHHSWGHLYSTAHLRLSYKTDSGNPSHMVCTAAPRVSLRHGEMLVTHLQGGRGWRPSILCRTQDKECEADDNSAPVGQIWFPTSYKHDTGAVGEAEVHVPTLAADEAFKDTGT